MNENKKRTKKTNKLFNFLQKYNHYDSTVLEHPNSDFFLTTSKTLTDLKDFKLFPKNQTFFYGKFSNLTNKTTKDLSLSPKISESSFKHRNFPSLQNDHQLKINDIPKIETSLLFQKKSEKTQNFFHSIEKKIIPSLNTQDNTNEKKSFGEHLNFLSQTDLKGNMEKKKWKNMIFDKNKCKDSNYRESEVFDIYSHNERRHSFIKELNYRLHYRKNINNKDQNKNSSKAKDFQSKNKTMQNIFKENANKLSTIAKEKSINNILKKKEAFQDMIFQKRKSKMFKLSMSNINTNSQINPGKKDYSGALPSDIRTRFLLFPSLVIQSIAEHLNYLKNYKNTKFFYTQVEQMAGANNFIKNSFIDIKSKKVREPISPKSIHMRLLMNEENMDRISSPDNKNNNNKLYSLFINNPYKKLQNDTVSSLIDFNFRLEENKISLEKKRIENFKEVIITEHKNILDEEINLMDKYKQTKKKEFYSMIKNILRKRNDLNITVPISDLSERLKKLGQLKFIKKDNIVNLEDFEQFLFEIRNLEVSLNNEVE